MIDVGVSATTRTFKIDRKTLRLYLENAAQAIPAVVNRLQQAGLDPISLTLTQPTLDDVFLQVTGQRFSAEQEQQQEEEKPEAQTA